MWPRFSTQFSERLRRDAEEIDSRRGSVVTGNAAAAHAGLAMRCCCHVLQGRREAAAIASRSGLSFKEIAANAHAITASV
eukprot:NODE_10753_length_1331_cov_4.778239.p3 GENE.NODE_10753_length_1331_cov_4.778239~~NODE_10753_length_1331_cov_4.778239.p3  ORF type:complete len:80 (-),score=8.05 NODE_10753_length_1331_cov_4.778239:414-653(-)